jgi:dipeptidyl aminopeptidase/acylaminoacyl peptidase
MKNKYNQLFGVVALLLLISCAVVSNPETEYPGISPSNLWTQTSIEKTIPIHTASPYKNALTETPNLSTKTQTFTPIEKLIKLNELPSGRYIVYSVVDITIDDYKHYIVSEQGEELGLISTEPAELYVSPNQKYIAVNGSRKIKIFDINRDEMRTLPIDENYFNGYGGLTWGPNTDQIAIANSSEIDIFSITDGSKVGKIAHILNPLPEEANFHESPKWSPDGKWIAYYVQTGQMESPQSPGPYVTDTSCMKNPKECEKKTKLIVKAPNQVIDWTPSNHLAIFDMSDRIRLYDVRTSSLLKEIQIPETIGSAEFFAWSNDDNWVAFGGRCGVCIMSIKTGETKVLSNKGYIIDFWYIVP